MGATWVPCSHLLHCEVGQHGCHVSLYQRCHVHHCTIVAFIKGAALRIGSLFMGSTLETMQQCGTWHPSGATVTRWLNAGLKRESEDPVFRQRIDELDRAISRARNNATMRNVAP